METVLVTGGAGFIGSHLADRLLETGHRVIVYDNFNDFYDPSIKRDNISGAVRHSDCELVEGDIRDLDLLRKTFERCRPTVVIHLAARAGVRPSLEQPRLYQDVNCTGTLNLLEVAREFPVENFVFGSSSSVYGVNPRVPFSEDDPVDLPISPYAATKRSNELMCRTYHHLYGMKIVCLRFFTVYGPRQRPDLAIHKFTRLIDRGEPVPKYGDGTSRRDYTYIDDILQGVVAAMKAEFGFEIVNLGESETTSLSELIELIENALGKKAQIEQMPTQAGDVPITYADISKARQLLYYDPHTKMAEGIERFVDWYRSSR